MATKFATFKESEIHTRNNNALTIHGQRNWISQI